MSDHFSGPAVMGDPPTDITDFFAFPSPERAGNLVLIMDVFPLATAHCRFLMCVNLTTEPICLCPHFSKDKI